jgi:site-specific recombinase XerD
MLEIKINQFLNYCNNSNFSDRSVETLTLRLKEFNRFISSGIKQITSVKQITYQHLTEFVADYNDPSVSVKKARVWTLRRFFHFLKLQQQIDKNFAQQLPYPKIEKTVADFLTADEFNRILLYFTQQAADLTGMRNLVLISLLGFLGLRAATIVAQDMDMAESCIWVREKGVKRQLKRKLPLPQVLCLLIAGYLQLSHRKQGPLFLSKRSNRLSTQSLQNLYRKSAGKVGINKRLHQPPNHHL